MGYEVAEAHAIDRSGERSAFARSSTIARPHDRLRGDLLGGAPGQPGIIWVRASDLLNSGTGRVAGRGLDLEAELARRMRRTAGTTRRAIRERADRLSPLSAFGQSRIRPNSIRHDLGRH
ncbi:hypothetical protein ACFQ58_08750 [Agromyces sp. NPDC056523]|uniref:hypothetical protein n=1 Tax=Agromyces sp. NPDC056523 TaxID=3345850 RepID=UPI003671F333